MAQARILPARDNDDAARRIAEFREDWDALAEEVAALSPEDRERFVREITEAIDNGIRRRVEQLDRDSSASR